MSRREMVGKIDKVIDNKTVKVLVIKTKQHKKYGKYFRTQEKYMAHHDSLNLSNGDVVTIEESKPISKRKKWAVVQ